MVNFAFKSYKSKSFHTVLSDRLVQLYRQGVSWAEMSRRCGIENDRYFSNMVRTGADPSLSVAARVASEFDFSLDEVCSVPPPNYDQLSIDRLISEYVKGGHTLKSIERFLPYCDIYHVPQPRDKTLRIDKLGAKSLLSRKIRSRLGRRAPGFAIKLVMRWLVNAKKGRSSVAFYKAVAAQGMGLREVRLDETVPEQQIKLDEHYLSVSILCGTEDGQRIVTMAMEIRRHSVDILSAPP